MPIRRKPVPLHHVEAQDGVRPLKAEKPLATILPFNPFDDQGDGMFYSLKRNRDNKVVRLPDSKHRFAFKPMAGSLSWLVIS